MFKKNIIIFLCIGEVLFSSSLYARRVKNGESFFIASEITLELLTSSTIWEYASLERYPWIEKSTPQAVPSGEIIVRLEEIKKKTILNMEDLGFLIAGLKHVATYHGRADEAQGFLEEVVLPNRIAQGEDIFKLMVDYLIWFYQQLANPSQIGVEVEGGLYHGTSLGLVIDAINSTGYIGSSLIFLTTNFYTATTHATPWLREQEVATHEKCGDPISVMPLSKINALMAPETQRRPDRYTPIVLTFRKSDEFSPVKRGIGPATEYVIGHRLNLNDLCLKSKEFLVKILGITEPKPWMDEEWIEIIRKNSLP